MYPSQVHTIIIGEIPPVIKVIQTINSELLSNLKIEHCIHYVKKTSTFPCCGVQSEFLRVSLLSSLPNILYCDWDVVLKSITETDDEVSFFGWNKSGPDTFIVYNNNKKVMRFFEKKLKTSLYSDCKKVGFTRNYAMELLSEGLIYRYPTHCNLHLEIGTSAIELPEGWHSLTFERKAEIDKYCVDKLISEGIQI